MKKLALWSLLCALALGLAGAGARVASAQDSAPQAAPGADEVAEELLEEEEGRTLADWFALGGNIMWILVVASMLSVGLILERVWALRRSAIIPRSFLVKLRDHAQRQEYKPVLELCAAGDNAIARVLRAGLIHFDQGYK